MFTKCVFKVLEIVCFVLKDYKLSEIYYKIAPKNVTFEQKANTNILICLVVTRWRHKQKKYKWRKNDHVLSDKNSNAKTKHKKQKGRKTHILMYLKIVNINIITKTKNVFKSIKLLAGYRYSFCTH